MSDEKRGRGRPPIDENTKKLREMHKEHVNRLVSQFSTLMGGNSRISEDDISRVIMKFYIDFYGRAPGSIAVADSKDEELPGIARAVLGFYQKAFAGDVAAFKTLMQLNNLDINRVDVTSGGDKMKTFTLNYSLED